MTEITNKTITPKALSTIVSDWQEELPTLSIWRKHWLIRRVGPTVVGVCIDVMRGKFDYRPTAFCHRLTSQSESVTFGFPSHWSPKVVAESIPPQFHDRHYKNAATYLCEHAYVPLDRSFSLGDVIAGYKGYLRDHPNREYAEIPSQLRFLAVCRETRKAQKLLRRIKRRYKPDDFHGYGGRDVLVEALEREIADPTILDRMVAAKIDKVGLGEIPYSDLDLNKARRGLRNSLSFIQRHR